MFLIRFTLTCSVILLASSAHAQVKQSRLDNGFTELASEHLTLVTDLPIDDEIRQLVDAFEVAMPQWQDYFGIEKIDEAPWRATVYLMGDRPKFVEAGYLTPELPPFLEGYQAGDRLFVCEQPSAYYRRHLLLHEGTHWYMARLFGGAGPPWFMEGTAELLATHSWDGKELRMGIIPPNNEGVPYWGRMGIIRDDFAQNRAPSLEKILRYDNTAHRQVEPYAWSWAAIHFFLNNPRTSVLLKELVGSKLDYSPKLTQNFFKRLKSEWPQIRVEWSGFISDFDLGAIPTKAIPRFTETEVPLQNSAQITIDADHGWQSSGVEIQRGKKIHIQATGSYVVGKDRVPLVCEPQGLSLQYHRGQRLGKLMAAIAEIPATEQAQTTRWTPIPVGRVLEFTPEVSGILFLKINEDVSGLSDNSGSLDVSIEAK
jgi:hypothetical protein